MKTFLPNRYFYLTKGYCWFIPLFRPQNLCGWCISFFGHVGRRYRRSRQKWSGSYWVQLEFLSCWVYLCFLLLLCLCLSRHLLRSQNVLKSLPQRASSLVLKRNFLLIVGRSNIWLIMPIPAPSNLSLLSKVCLLQLVDRNNYLTCAAMQLLFSVQAILKMMVLWFVLCAYNYFANEASLKHV